MHIPYNRPTIGEEEIAEVADTLRSGWITTGPKTAQFEQEFQNHVGASHALAVNSCTGGLHLALAALGIGPGDEVITTPLTFCATVNTILQVGATPVLADVGEDGNLDPESVATRITSRTKALLPVHLGGLPCEMDALWSLAREHGLKVVEDAAHAVGSQYRGIPIGGGMSDAVAFSFYATKNLTTGEGGMVTTPHQELAERMRVLCLHGISRDAWNRYTEHGNWYYEVQACGFKYNLGDVQAAIGIHQLRKLEKFIDTRARLAAVYAEELREVEELETPVEPAGVRHAWHLYAVRLRLEKLSMNRDAFIRALCERGIGTSVHFIPIPLHPAYAGHAGLSAEQCPRAMALYPRLVSLPLYPLMPEEQVRYVAAAIKEVVRA
jgi:dTDP-4-amino-4,6-dideoxygalactose transaminase